MNIDNSIQEIALFMINIFGNLKKKVLLNAYRSLIKPHYRAQY